VFQETEDILTTLERLTGDLVRSLTDAGDAALDWRPSAPETNYPAAIATHALGASRHWLAVIVAGESDDRDREAEFRVSSLTVAGLTAQADEWLVTARRVLGSLSQPDLDGPCRKPVERDWMSSLTARGAILHVIEHLGMHIGHLDLTLQLWRAQRVAA
jgi:Protein of unknown function (DUF664)